MTSNRRLEVGNHIAMGSHTKSGDARVLGCDHTVQRSGEGKSESVGKEGEKMVRRKVTDVEILLRFQDLVMHIQRRSAGGVLIARRECRPPPPPGTT